MGASKTWIIEDPAGVVHRIAGTGDVTGPVEALSVYFAKIGFPVETIDTARAIGRDDFLEVVFPDATAWRVHLPERRHAAGKAA